jgi:anti-sigma B factor antagonist
MEFTIEKKGNYTLYILSGRLLGEIDGQALKDSIAQSIENGEKYFILNMSGLEYMNSTGVGILVTLLTKARHADGELVLLAPSSNVSTVLTMTRLNTIFKIFNAENEAITAFV